MEGKKMPSLGIGLHGVMKWLLYKRLLIIWWPHKFLKIGCWLLTCWPVICDPALSSASPAPAGDNSWGDTRILRGGSREETGATVRRDTVAIPMKPIRSKMLTTCAPAHLLLESHPCDKKHIRRRAHHQIMLKSKTDSTYMCRERSGWGNDRTP